MNEILLALLALAFGLIKDIITALYISNISKGKKTLSTIYSLLAEICIFVSIYLVINEWWMAIFWLVGCGIGTYWSKDIEKFILKKFQKNELTDTAKEQ